MSATDTTTPETAKLGTKAARESFYKENHSSGVTSAVADMHRDEESLAVSQRAVGRVVSSAVAALLAVGASTEEAQGLILADIGGDYSWSYVSSWQTAARVFDSLNEENQTLYGGSTESLKQLNRFKPEKRNDVATKQAKNGKPASVRTLRALADKQKGGSSRKRNTTNGVDTLVTKLAKEAGKVKPPSGLAWSASVQKFVTDMCLVSARAAKNGKALSTTERNAIEQLTYFGPKGADS